MKPILFNTEMVKAILEGKKTQTRRVVKGLPNDQSGCDLGIIKKTDGSLTGHGFEKIPCQVGDILWVRETWRTKSAWGGSYRGCEVEYKTGGETKVFDDIIAVPETKTQWKPSIHMPRKAARIFLKVTGVRVERLQDITLEKARAESFDSVKGFITTWNQIYGNWAENPWVWVYEFERTEEST